jgi:hypothetical protein
MRRCPQEADENSDESDIDRSRLPRIMDDARRSKENGLQRHLSRLKLLVLQ